MEALHDVVKAGKARYIGASSMGPTKPHHLPDTAAALDLHLTDDEVRALEEHYALRLPTGF
jgi:aryl-alcohol dehydrogenase-like predicted oxidoreductase